MSLSYYDKLLTGDKMRYIMCNMTQIAHNLYRSAKTVLTVLLGIFMIIIDVWAAKQG